MLFYCPNCRLVSTINQDEFSIGPHTKVSCKYCGSWYCIKTEDCEKPQSLEEELDIEYDVNKWLDKFEQGKYDSQDEIVLNEAISIDSFGGSSKEEDAAFYKTVAKAIRNKDHESLGKFLMGLAREYLESLAKDAMLG